MFEKFHEHDVIEVLDINHNENIIKYRSKTGSDQIFRSYINLPYVRSSIYPGRNIAVQYGKTTKGDVEDSRRRISRHERKISALKHPDPSVSPLGLSLIKWTMGEDEALNQLRYYHERANTNHNNSSYLAIDGTLAKVEVYYGCLSVSMTIGAADIKENTILLQGNYPENILLSAIGRDISELIDHPGFKNGGEIARVVNRGNNSVHIALKNQKIAIKDII